MRYFFCGVTIALLSLLGCSRAVPSAKPLAWSPSMNLLKLPGEWTIVARIPTIVDRSAMQETASIELFADYSMSLHWTIENSTGEPSHWSFRVLPGSGMETSLWTVAPFWPLKFHVQITEFSADSSWFVLASTDRRYVWIFSREKVMSPLLLDGLIAHLKATDFDVGAMIRQ